jgi:ATP-dependent RNA helicase DeaD
LVRAYRSALPNPEELIEGTPQARAAAQADKHRPGFEDTVWFRMDIGRRQNADPRWVLPLICRRGHVTKTEIGAIRIAANETWFQIPSAVSGKFAAAVARTAGADGSDESGVRIELAEGSPAETPRAAARQNRGQGGQGVQRSSAPKSHRKGPRSH